MTASTIKALSAQLAAKEVSAEELARHYLSRIEAGAHLNAFTHVDAEATLAQARAA
ncbi:MAG: Asp-tRNA(Asn)/Glu-tRNA(Gln) amidotransferase GatCAB subunit A, partial [Ralstonia sp.]|nr:Asp-tRNA(Asn)/Glu-tRNA(Gln) amidotransferase GatCAB subunit A [Ralstonia sp.]